MHVFQCLESQLVGKLDCIHLLLLWFFLREKPWMGNSGIWDASCVKCKWLRYATSILMDKVIQLNDWSVNVIWHFFFFFYFIVLFLRIFILLSSLGQCVYYTKSPHSYNNGRNLEVVLCECVCMCVWGGSYCAFVVCAHVCLLLPQNKSLTLNTALQWIPHHCWNSM